MTASSAGPASPLRPNYLPVVPSLIFLAAFFVIPLLFTAYESLTGNVLIPFVGTSGRNYAYLLNKPFYWTVIYRTLRTGLVSTLVAVALGYPAGFLLSRAGRGLNQFAFAVMTLSILAGPLVVILGWMALLSDGGPVLRPLETLHLIPPLRLIGTENAIDVSLVHFTLPFIVMTLHATFKQIPESAIEAAASLGASRWQILRHVIGPLSLPGLLSASVIAFTLSAGSYVSPHYMGGASQPTLATVISDFVLGTYNMPMAATASTVLVVVMAAITAGLTRLLSRLVAA